MRKKEEKIVILRRYGVIFVCLALIFTLMPIGIFKILAMQRDTTSWPSVQGTVIICEIEHRENPNADRVDEQDEYRIDLVYNYTVYNETYENFNVYYWGGTGSYWDHELDSYEYSLLHDYPVGSNVRVYYNPENPEQSCLLTGEDPSTRILIIWLPVTGYIMLACIPLFYFADKFAKKRKKKKSEGKSFMTPALEDKIKEIKKATES